METKGTQKNCFFLKLTCRSEEDEAYIKAIMKARERERERGGGGKIMNLKVVRENEY
jgi:hypothetical protein